MRDNNKGCWIFFPDCFTHKVLLWQRAWPVGCVHCWVRWWTPPVQPGDLSWPRQRLARSPRRTHGPSYVPSEGIWPSPPSYLKHMDSNIKLLVCPFLEVVEHYLNFILCWWCAVWIKYCYTCCNYQQILLEDKTQINSITQPMCPILIAFNQSGTDKWLTAFSETLPSVRSDWSAHSKSGFIPSLIGRCTAAQH